MSIHVRFARLLVGLAALSLAGCASFGRVEILEARTGERVVRVRSTQSFDDLALAIFGDASRGRELAALARMPYERPVPRGTVLVVPGAGPAKLREADALYQQGVAAAATKDYVEAARLFRECLKRDPDRIEAAYNLGLALAENGELREATTVLEEVVRARPDHAESRYGLGSVLHVRKEYARALSEFEAAYEADPSMAKAAYAAARTLEDLEDPAAARAAWKRFLERFPHDRLARDAANRLAALEGEASEKGSTKKPKSGSPPR